MEGREIGSSAAAAVAGGAIWETSAWACRLLFPSQQWRVCPRDGSPAFVEDRLAKTL